MQLDTEATAKWIEKDEMKKDAIHTEKKTHSS